MFGMDHGHHSNCPGVADAALIARQSCLSEASVHPAALPVFAHVGEAQKDAVVTAIDAWKQDACAFPILSTDFLGGFPGP